MWDGGWAVSSRFLHVARFNFSFFSYIPTVYNLVRLHLVPAFLHVFVCFEYFPVLQIHDILVWIRIRILLFSSLTPTKNLFKKKGFSAYYFLKVYLHNFSQIRFSKRSHKTVEKKVFLTIFADPQPDPQHWNFLLFCVLGSSRRGTDTRTILLDVPWEHKKCIRGSGLKGTVSWEGYLFDGNEPSNSVFIYFFYSTETRRV